MLSYINTVKKERKRYKIKRKNGKTRLEEQQWHNSSAFVHIPKAELASSITGHSLRKPDFTALFWSRTQARTECLLPSVVGGAMYRYVTEHVSTTSAPRADRRAYAGAITTVTVLLRPSVYRCSRGSHSAILFIYIRQQVLDGDVKECA